MMGAERSVARLRVGPQHLNAGGFTQGGAVFTLADLTLAATANAAGTLALSLSTTIQFLRATTAGDVLTAEAVCLHAGRRTGCYEVRVTDQEGRLVAVMTGSSFRTGSERGGRGAAKSRKRDGQADGWMCSS